MAFLTLVQQGWPKLFMRVSFWYFFIEVQFFWRLRPWLRFSLSFASWGHPRELPFFLFFPVNFSRSFASSLSITPRFFWRGQSASFPLVLGFLSLPRPPHTQFDRTCMYFGFVVVFYLSFFPQQPNSVGNIRPYIIGLSVFALRVVWPHQVWSSWVFELEFPSAIWVFEVAGLGWSI